MPDLLPPVTLGLADTCLYLLYWSLITVFRWCSVCPVGTAHTRTRSLPMLTSAPAAKRVKFREGITGISRNNGWAAAGTGLITAVLGPLNPRPSLSTLDLGTGVTAFGRAGIGLCERQQLIPSHGPGLARHHPSTLTSSRRSLFHPGCLRCLPLADTPFI